MNAHSAGSFLGSDSAAALLHSIHHLELRRSAPVSHRLELALPRTILLNEEAGAGAAEVAAALAGRLHWPVYDHELVELIAGRMRVPVERLEEIDERHVGWFEECLQALGSAPRVSEAEYVRQLANVLFELRDRGNAIIVNHAAAQALVGQRSLRVRLVAPLAERAAKLRGKLRASQSEAERRVARLDREHDEFARLHFHRDPNDLRNYDLLLNTGRLSVDECAELILDVVRLQTA